MPPPRARITNLVDHSNGRVSSLSISTAPYGQDTTTLTLADETSGHPQPIHTSFQDSFVYYQAFVDASLPHGSTHEFAQNDDRHTCHTRVIGPQIEQAVEPLQQVRAGAVPDNLAVRLANCSNGAPLATIIEQGSYSTLNSRGSLLSVGRYPSLVENTSPSRISHRVSRSLAENAMHRIQKGALWEPDLCAVADADDSFPHGGRKRLYPMNDATSLKELVSPQISQSPGALFDAKDYDVDSRSTKGFFRGVLQNVRAASRTHSRSSSKTHTSIAESLEDRAKISASSSKSQLQTSDTLQANDDKLEGVYLAQPSSLTATFKPGPNPQARNRKILTTNSEHLNRVYAPLLNCPLSKLDPNTDFGSVPRLLPPSGATGSRERSTSVRLVQPEPRDGEYDVGTAGAPMFSSESRNDTSARYMFDGVSMSHDKATSLKEYNGGRESSREASFCSTLSTSYSGTVLGIDLDLHHELAHPVHQSRSSTPVPPEWFTPQMAELELQASVSDSPELKQAFATETPSRSITSSALTSLLPIAAASGIVRLNYNTPKISFYSPSGNLIQPEGSSTPGTSASDIRQNVLSTTACTPPVRPALVPMTTPPISLAPLPAHLRHHHNFRHPEKSQIDPSNSCIVSSPAVKGCGGIVRENSVTPGSETEQSHKKNTSVRHHKNHQFTRSFIREVRGDAKFYKSRLIGLACTSHHPLRKRKTLQKRHSTHGYNAASYVYTSKPKKRTVGAKSTHKKVRTNRNAEEERNTAMLGPLSAYALRICFCQPFDGAGRQTQAVAADASCMNKPKNLSTMHDPDKKKNAVHQSLLEVDAELPNARMIHNLDKKKVARKSRASSPTGKHSRTRSDSVLSVGVGLRVATVGG